MTGTEELRDYQARCIPHIAVLHMFASDMLGTPLPPDATEQVAQATSAILAEAKAAGRAALAAVSDSRPRSANLSLLAARQARLEHAADDAVASAREAAYSGNIAALRQRLQRFVVLTTAMWTVQLSVCEQPGAPAAEWHEAGAERIPVSSLRAGRRSS